MCTSLATEHHGEVCQPHSRVCPKDMGHNPHPAGIQVSVIPAAGQGRHMCPAHPKQGDAGGWAVRAACRRQPIMPY